MIPKASLICVGLVGRRVADLTPAMRRKVEAYARRLAALSKRNAKIRRRDVVKIHSLFSSFRNRAVAAIPVRYSMNATSIAQILSSVAVELDRLAVEYRVIFRGGVMSQADLVAEALELYGQQFLPLGSQAPAVGLRAVAVQSAAQFSADLIGLTRGGLAARMLGEVNRVLRLSALGAGPNAFNAAVEINTALLGPGSGWSWQAERIYRTEVLRIHSLLMDSSVRELNARRPTAKVWIWSGISRIEHSKVDRQVISVDGAYLVPLRSGGSVRMRFPRDPSAPPDATINCGCTEGPVPAEAADSFLAA